MENENMNNEAQEVGEVVAKSKRVRKTYKIEMTGDEIVQQIKSLEAEVAQMESEVDEIAPHSSFRAVAEATLAAKKEELGKAYTTVYRA